MSPTDVRNWQVLSVRVWQTGPLLKAKPTRHEHRQIDVIDRGCGKTRLQRMVGWLEHPMRHGPSANPGDSASDCLQQRRDTVDREHPLHVVGQNMKAHL